MENGKSKIRDHYKQRILITTVPGAREQVLDKFPNTINGIPIRVTEGPPPATKEMLQHCGGACYLDRIFDYGLPGGAKVHTLYNGYCQIGTACITAYKNANEYTVTARHLFNPDRLTCTRDTDSLIHHKQDIGKIATDDEQSDLATVKIDQSSGVTDGDDRIYISQEDYDAGPFPVDAYFTDAGLKDAEAALTNLTTQGRATGHQIGVIKEYPVTSTIQCTDDNRFIRHENNTSKGDSGGPLFQENYQNETSATVAGMMSWGAGDTGEVSCFDAVIRQRMYCSPIYRLVNEHGYYIGASYDGP